MIVKALLATAALVGSVGVMAPIALGASGDSDACGVPTIEPTPTNSVPPTSGPAFSAAGPSVATNPLRTGTASTGTEKPDSGLLSTETPNTAPTHRRLPEAEPAAGTPACEAPAGTGGQLPDADQAVARAMRLVGSHGYYQLCARLAANIWGRPRAGYFSAAEQWRQMVATNKAHPGDRRPPSGALVFWETGGPYGHVAVYLGDGRIVSNDINDDVPGEGGVYLVDFGLIESKWGATYLGWAPPIYSTT